MQKIVDNPDAKYYKAYEGRKGDAIWKGHRVSEGTRCVLCGPAGGLVFGFTTTIIILNIVCVSFLCTNFKVKYFNDHHEMIAH